MPRTGKGDLRDCRGGIAAGQQEKIRCRPNLDPAVSTRLLHLANFAGQPIQVSVASRRAYAFPDIERLEIGESMTVGDCVRLLGYRVVRTAARKVTGPGGCALESVWACRCQLPAEGARDATYPEPPFQSLIVLLPDLPPELTIQQCRASGHKRRAGFTSAGLVDWRKLIEYSCIRCEKSRTAGSSQCRICVSP